MKRLFSLIKIVGVSLLFLGCVVPTQPSAPATVSGYFIDGPLAGLGYQTSSGLKGVTDADGLYIFKEGDTVEFSLGGQPVGSPVAAATTISPLTVCQATSLDDTPEGVRATNLIRLLLALDDGTNPFGLTIPASVAEAAGQSDLNTLLGSATFAAEATLLVAEATGVLESEVDLPDPTEAENHWDLSAELAAGLEDSSSDTLVLAVRVPAGFEGRRLQFTYHAQTMLDGMTSYPSGQYHTITASDNGIVVFKGQMHSSNWQLSLSLFKSDDKVQVGDLLSFFHTTGFAATLPSGYELDLTQGRRVLQADLSSDQAAQVSTVYPVSGHLVLAQFLPDGSTDWAEDWGTPGVRSISFSVFSGVQNGGQSVASFAVTLALGDMAALTPVDVDGVSSYRIPFSTTLPAGYAYALQSYYRTKYPGGWETYAFATVPSLDATNGLNVELKDLIWKTPLF